MKKLILAFAALLALPAMAQTNFRSLTLDQAVEQAKKENKLVLLVQHIYAHCSTLLFHDLVSDTVNNRLGLRTVSLTIPRSGVRVSGPLHSTQNHVLEI